MTPINNTPPEQPDAQQPPYEGLDGAYCSALLDATKAPRDGTVILGAFGWPFLIPAAWNEHDERWTVCTLQASQMDSGKSDVWWENDWEHHNALLGWAPMPILPDGTPKGGFLSLPNSSVSPHE
jgi:hypothetical protein